jgi:glutamate/tyrosine decarboxylase-like PLP-dependent enzyme
MENHREEVLNSIFNLINLWLRQSANPDNPVNNYRVPEQLSHELGLKIEKSGINDKELINEVEKYLNYSVKTGHPHYLNQLFGGFNFPAFIGEIITALTNTSMYTYEVAPVATLMEMRLIEKMLGFTGWETGTGAMMTGGSNTNMVAMLLARNSIFKGAKMEGITGLPKLALFVSERSHFSMLKGANTIGIGQNGVVKVKLDENGRMRGKALKASIETALKKGLLPFMVCSTAGTTETGSFDAIDEIADVAKTHDLWHHVDGSWGGSVVLSEKRRNLLAGLEEADSFSWNPHKLMNIPLICSVLLVKGDGIMREEIQSQDADYIYHENDTSAYDLGPSSLQCGRRVDSLKLWLAWKYYGDEGYSNRIEHLFDLAEYATDFIEDNQELEIMFPTQSLNVNFRFKTPEGINTDRFNENLRYELLKKGKVMVNYCWLDSGLSIRLILLNPDLSKGDIDRFFKLLLDEARALLKRKAKSLSD